MTTAAYEDVSRVLPGRQDRTLAEILEMKATVDELEAALVVLCSNQRVLIDFRMRVGNQIHGVLRIPGCSQIQARENRVSFNDVLHDPAPKAASIGRIDTE